MTGLGLDFEDDFFFEEDKMLVDGNCKHLAVIRCALRYSLNVLSFGRNMHV